MTNSTCRWVRSRLPLAAGGELLGLDRRRVERHVLECPACRLQLEDLRQTVACLQDAGAISPLASTASLWPQLARQIRESRAVNIDRLSWPRRLALPLAAALLLSMLAGLLATRWDRTHALFGRRIHTVSRQDDTRKLRKATIVRPVAPAPATERPLVPPGPETAVAPEPPTRSVGLTQ